MKVIVIDIETTGFSDKWDAIVEIGISLVDTVKKTRELIFDEVIRDKKFQPDWEKHQTAWIFSNSDLKIEDVVAAKSLKSYEEELQRIFDKYPVTAFNSKFDFKFMKSRGFELNEIKCLMLTSQKELKMSKYPSVIHTYKEFFPDETDWDEEHRGGSDAMDEAKILLHLCEMKEKRLLLKST